MDHTLIDTHKLTRLGQTVQGQTRLSSFERLVSDLPQQGDTQATWSITGHYNDQLDQASLDVSVSAVVELWCQRCMKTMPYPVDSVSRLRVVHTQAEVDAQDLPDTSPDDWVEPVLASSRLDALALVEDELILGLPYVPLHDQCSTQQDSTQPATDDDDSNQASPFAILDKLRKN